VQEERQQAAGLARGFIALVATAVALVAGQAAIGSAQASTVNVNPVAPSGNNSFPFGRGDLWTPQMGFVYKNIPAFDLKPGDTIAFDLGAQNEVDIQLQIDMAATTVNGGDLPGTYTTIVPNTQVPLNPRGNAVMGDYELQFTAQAPFNFAGGGMIIRFSNPGGAFASDTVSSTPTMLNVTDSSDTSGFFVKRFFGDADGLPPYSLSDPGSIPGFHLNIADVPAPPAAAPTATPKKKCKKHKKRSTAAAKKCKKKRR
jgi:hypothetical protein